MAEFARNSVAEEFLRNCDAPRILRGFLRWPCRSWALGDWEKVLGSRQYEFRIGRRPTEPLQTPQWETDSQRVRISLERFMQWQNGSRIGDLGPDTHWGYLSYFHLRDTPEARHHFRWQDFGVNSSGEEGTLWIGSQGANTPCHR